MEYWKRVRESGVGDGLLILPGANVFIENAKGEILMHTGYRHEKLCFIGGFQNDNESLWQTAKRETKEETNLDIKNLIPFAFRDDPDTIKIIEGKHKAFNQIMYFYTKNYSGEIILEKKEIKETKWVDISKKKFRLNIQRGVNAFLEWKQTGQFQYITNKE